MVFYKLDDNKIQCVIGQDELNSLWGGIDEFFEDRSKMELFVRGVIEEAKHTIDVDLEGQFYSVQMSVMPEGEISIVICGEKGRLSTAGSKHGFDDILKQFEEIRNATSTLDGAQNISLQDMLDSMPSSGDNKAKKAPSYKPLSDSRDAVVASFDSLSDAINASKLARSYYGTGIYSESYKYNDKYYIIVHNFESDRGFANVIMVFSDYANEIIPYASGGGVIREHGKAISKNFAIDALSEI